MNDDLFKTNTMKEINEKGIFRTTKDKNGLNRATHSNEKTPSNIITPPLFSVVIDNGKPYTETANNEDELFNILKKNYAESQNTEYPYFDIKIYNKDGDDISEQQFISEMISVIMDEDGQNE